MGGFFIRCALFAHDVCIAHIGFNMGFLVFKRVLWFFCENGGDGSAGLSASLQSRLLPHPKGSEAHLRDIQPSGLNVLGKIGIHLWLWDSRRNAVLQNSLLAFSDFIFGKHRHGGLTRAETRINKTHIENGSSDLISLKTETEIMRSSSVVVKSCNIIFYLLGFSHG